MRIVGSAPGKLVLLGEYAVLEGAPALVVAVNRRARVTITQTGGKDYVIDAPSLGVRDARCRLRDGRIGWSDRKPAAADKLILACSIIEAEAGGAPLSAFRAMLDTDAFFTGPGGSKLGLGSSAALTVAFSGAIHALRRGPAPQMERLIAVHRQMQGGHGSGLDIAASLNGGVIAYRMGDGRPGVEPLGLPTGVGIACVWSGKSASTGDFLQRLASWHRHEPTGYNALMKRLGMVAEAGVAAARNDDAAGFLDAAAHYAERLVELGRASGVDIVTPEHVKMAEVAAASGVVYKTCGAGGGDIGIAFATDDDRLADFRQRLEKMDFHALELTQDPQGLRTE
jgi:phosphomevalonate kinase